MRRCNRSTFALLLASLVSAPLAAHADDVAGDAAEAPALEETAPPEPVATPAPATATDPAPEPSSAKRPTWSLAFERVGGIAYAGVSADDADASVSAFTIGVGGPTVNPYAVPRLGIDLLLESGVTLGIGLGISHLTAGLDANGQDNDLASLLLYTITPRVGYRASLSDTVDITPRAGFTLMGGQLKTDDGDNSSGVFIVAIGADAPIAFRLTESLNFLTGVSFDISLAGTATSDAVSQDIDGTIFAVQAWIGMGGYL